jgi:hypothetical protein
VTYPQTQTLVWNLLLIRAQTLSLYFIWPN